MRYDHNDGDTYGDDINDYDDGGGGNDNVEDAVDNGNDKDYKNESNLILISK